MLAHSRKKLPRRLTSICIVISLGMGALTIGVIGAQQDGEGEWLAPAIRERMTEEDVTDRLARLNSDLTMLHVGLESYRVDWEVYPDTLHRLTTPVAYLMGPPEDTFAEFAMRQRDAVTGELLSLASGGLLQMRFMPGYEELRLFSIGPDGRDRRAELIYDPTNGVMSDGDVVRSVELEDYIVIADPDLRSRVETQREETRLAANIVRFWAMENGRMPESWEDIAAIDPDFTVPRDLFAEDQTLRYIYEEPLARIYSIGPNAEDNGGTSVANGVYRTGEVPSGDIVATVSWEEVREQISRADDPFSASDDPYLQALLDKREETGRDNALIYFQAASRLAPESVSNENDELMRRIIQQGWAPEADALLPTVRGWENSLELVKEGARVGHAEGVGFSRGFDTMVPQLMFPINAARVLAANARRLESTGDHDTALNNYMLALRMANAYASEGNVLFGPGVARSSESVVQLPLAELIRSGKLDEEDLLLAQETILGIETSFAGVASAIEGEQSMVNIQVRELTEMANQTGDEGWREVIKRFTDSETQPERPSRQLAKQLVIQYRMEMADQFNAAFEVVRRSSFEIDFDEARSREFIFMMESESPLSKILPCLEFRVSEDVMIAKRRLLLAQIALERHKLQHDRYPESLEELRGAFVDELPTDPFSGEPFRYQPTGDGADYVMYSIGPDKQDNPQAGEYDAANGTFSAGVID